MLRKVFAFFTHADASDDGFSSTHRPGTLDHSIDWIRGQLREIEKLTSVLCVSLILAILLYTAAVGVREGKIFSVLMVVGMSGLAAVWGLVSGGALGFLFGIPKLPRQLEDGEGGKPPERAIGERRSVAKAYIRSNSNLEEISDWLTKIIVGLGLIHLSAIPAYLGNYRGWLKRSVESAGVTDPMGFSWFLLVVTLAAALIGFLFFYVQARTRMAVLLRETEFLGGRDPTPSEMQRAIEGAQVVTAQGGSLEEAVKSPAFKPGRDILSAQPIEGDAVVLAQMPQPSDSADRWGAWAAANARAGDLQKAAFGWYTAVERSGADRGKRAQLHEKYAEVLQALERNSEALAHYAKAREFGADEYSILVRELLVALYVPPPEGFTRALDVSDQLLARHADRVKDNPWIKVWRLAAYGQKHRWYLARGERKEADEAAQAAKQLIRELLAECPDPQSAIRSFLRQLIDPVTFHGDLTEDDLVSFRQIPEIYNLITKGSPN
jgi:tetratricopeptide (TPR) repeat protein